MGAPQATQIANVVDISKMKAKIFVAEKDVFHIHVGDPAEITTDVDPRRRCSWKQCSQSVRRGMKAIHIQWKFFSNNPKQELRAGMFITITINAHSGGESIVIPRAALVGSIQDAKVFVVKNKIASLRSVVAKDEIGTNVEISSGLEAEPHAAVAKWEGKKLTVWASTQGVNGFRDDLAKTFKVDKAEIRVITQHMGGGFGSKFGMQNYGALAALMAQRAGAPGKTGL